MKRAYELALSETGNDIDSGVIWKEYIAFLGEKEVSIEFYPRRPHTDQYRSGFQCMGNSATTRHDSKSLPSRGRHTFAGSGTALERV